MTSKYIRFAYSIQSAFFATAHYLFYFILFYFIFDNLHYATTLIFCSFFPTVFSLSRRCGMKKMGEREKKYVHMLNATLCATGRAICCLLETYQVRTELCRTVLSQGSNEMKLNFYVCERIGIHIYNFIHERYHSIVFFAVSYILTIRLLYFNSCTVTLDLFIICFRTRMVSTYPRCWYRTWAGWCTCHSYVPPN